VSPANAPLPELPKQTTRTGKHVNRVIDMWLKGQPVYYSSTDDGGYENGKKMAGTKADYINYGMEHGPLDFKGLHDFMQGLVDAGPTTRPTTQATTQTAATAATVRPVVVAVATTQGATSQPTTKPSRGQVGGMASKNVRQITFDENATVTSVTLADDQSLLRRTHLEAATVQYDMLLKKLLVPVPGRMIVEDHRPATTQPVAGGGTGTEARPAARFSGTPASVRRGAPALGEHTEEILDEIGFREGIEA